MIDEIVAEVLEKLRPRLPAAPKSNACNGHRKQDYVEFHERVITEETIKSRNPRNLAILIKAKAILTPSARDYIRTQKIQLTRTNNESPAGSGSDRTNSQSKIIAAHLPEAVQTLLADVRRNAPLLWSVEIESGVLPVVERVRSIICRGEARQAVVLVQSSHAVSCLVNRNSQCRSAVVRDVEDVRRVREEAGANVLCIDLERPTFIGLRRIVEASVKTMGQIREPRWS